MKNEAFASQFFPDAWKTQPLAKISDVFADGDWIESKDQADSGVRLIQTGNVGMGQFKDRSEKARFIDEATFLRLKCFEVIPGDLLISRLPDPVGRACIVPDTAQKMITAVDCSIVRVQQATIDPKFFVYYSQTQEYLRAVDDLCSGTTRRRISRKNLGNVLVPLPPLEEQKRIVAILDQAFAALDRARALAEANLADVGHLFDAWLTAVFHDHPSSWRTEKLRSLCHQITVGHVGPMAERYVESGISFLRSQNIRPFEINLVDVKFIDEDFHGELKKSALAPGDVAIVRTGYPGTAAVIPQNLPVSNCADLVIARPKDMISPEFLVMFLNSSFGKSMVAGKAVGAAQKHFNVGAAKEVDFSFPPIAEQERLVVQAKWMRSRSGQLNAIYQAKLTDLANLRQSLLQKAFSGQLT